MADSNTLSLMLVPWEVYQGHLIDSIAPLTLEQLALRAAPHLRSINSMIAHMIGALALSGSG